MPYYVYVIALDRDRLLESNLSERFLSENRETLRSDGRCYYVGQSSHEPECRHRQHLEMLSMESELLCTCSKQAGRMDGKRSGRGWVSRFGMGLRPSKYRRHNPVASEAESKDLEEKIGLRLRKQGHGAWWR